MADLGLYLAVARTSEYTLCALDVQYIIFSWATNFPYLPHQTRNPRVNVVLLVELAIVNDSHNLFLEFQ